MPQTCEPACCSPAVRRSGGPSRVTETLSLFVYNEGFQYFRMGSAASAGLLMVLAALLASLIALRVIRRESL